MQSSQAINCIKALSQFERRITFERNDQSTGYIIRVDGVTYESDRERIRKIAKTLNLQVTEDKEGITLM